MARAVAACLSSFLSVSKAAQPQPPRTGSRHRRAVVRFLSGWAEENGGSRTMSSPGPRIPLKELLRHVSRVAPERVHGLIRRPRSRKERDMRLSGGRRARLAIGTLIGAGLALGAL